MSAIFYGADVAQLRQLANTMRTAGRKLDAQRLAFNSGVAGTLWPGQDAEEFRQEWKAVHSPSLRAAATLMQQVADDLMRQADDQQSASAASGGLAVGSLPSRDRIREPRPEDLHGKSSADVRTWWLGLASDQQQAFIRNHPVLAGNTNGIPFDARIEANRINAQSRIDWLKNNDPEPKMNPWILDSSYPARFAAEHEAWQKRQDGLKYLQKVVEGKVRLAAYDPAVQSIVELNGTYDQNTTSVITYVPGTTTNEASFYGGRLQEVAGRLVTSDESGGTAAFVYKGSEFPDGDPVEAFLLEAKSDEFVAGSAPALKAFQDAVELERPVGAQSVGVGHSWGVRNLTGAELQGAHFDKLIALSGAAMPPGWMPDPHTAYSSYTYPDILLTAEANGVVGENYPMKEPAFEKHVYEPPGGSGWTEFYSIDNHSLIATTDPRNEKPLEDVREEILGR